MDRIPIQRALISVSDKGGLAELVKELTAAGVRKMVYASSASVYGRGITGIQC